MAWFRFYADTMRHPKILALRTSEFITWVELLCLSSSTNSNGYLPDPVIIGKATGKKAATIRQQISKFLAIGLVDNEQGRMRLHNWEKHQYKHDVSTERVRKFRAKGNRFNQFHETSPDTDTDTEIKKEAPSSPPKKKNMGCRLPDDWQPTFADMEFATDQLGRERAGVEVDTFRDYWHAKTGQLATKLDWSATWRNWIRKALQQSQPPPRTNGHAYAPRPGSSEHRKEQMHHVIQALDEIASGKAGQRGCSDFDPPAAGFLPLGKPR